LNYNTTTGEYQITVDNSGDQQIVAGRLLVAFVDKSGFTQSANPNITDLQGNPISPTSAILPGDKVQLIAGLPSGISNPTYVYIYHQACGKISNDYLLG